MAERTELKDILGGDGRGPVADAGDVTTSSKSDPVASAKSATDATGGKASAAPDAGGDKSKTATTTTDKTKGDDKKTATPADGEDDKPVTRGQLAALTAERDKRQKLEAELAEARKQIPAARPRQRPDAFRDPQGAAAFDQDEAAAARIVDKVNTSHELMMETAAIPGSHVADYPEVIKRWPELMRLHPQLYAQSVGTSNPAKFCYQQTKRWLAAEEIEAAGGSAKYREKIEKEAREKWEAEAAEKAAAAAGGDATAATKTAKEAPVDPRDKAIDGMPKSLAKEPAATTRTEGPKFKGKTSLADALKQPARASG